MATAPKRVALIGYGMAGSLFHAPFIATTAGLELAAVVTRDPERQRFVDVAVRVGEIDIPDATAASLPAS